MVGTSSFSGVLKKDFLLMRSHLVAVLILNTAAFILGWYLYSKLSWSNFDIGLNGLEVIDDHLIKFIPLLTISVLHVFFLSVYMFSSLNKEAKKMHLWLHNPQPSFQLIASKFLNGFCALIISQATIIIFILINFIPLYGELQSPILAEIFNFASLEMFYIISISTVLSITVLFFWVIYRFIKTRIGKGSKLILFLIIIVSLYFFNSLMNLSIIEVMLEWGAYEIYYPSIFVSGAIYAGSLLFFLIFTACLFFISSWLIDKKLEV
ncbi:hypothetical protein V1503_06375 [Bacillus sp. SCS-151]|uniref:hypothetical protein n=1 Tax=Nanhaiella sioensis TaxID=3115293 RepID=UPI00397C7CFA